jgi:hypothetical protein
MVPKESLVCGHDKESARVLLEEHPDLDVIPIESDGKASTARHRSPCTINQIK